MSFTTDSGSNIKSAIGKFPEPIFKIPCAAHRLNLCVNDLFNTKNVTEKNQIFSIFDYNEEGELRKIQLSDSQKQDIEDANGIKEKVTKVTKTCKTLVGSIRHSEKLTRQLAEKQLEQEPENRKKLVQDVSTRWGSTHDLISSVLNNKPSLVSLSCVSGNKLTLPKEDGFLILEDILKLLEPLKEITTVLSARNYVVVTHLYPSLYNLIYQELEDLELQTDEGSKLKSILIESLKKRFSYLLNGRLFKGLTFLDTDYKHFEFITDITERTTQLGQAKEFLIEFFEKNKHKYSQDKQSCQPVNAPECHLSSTTSPIIQLSQTSLDVPPSSSKSFSTQSSIPTENQSLNENQPLNQTIAPQQTSTPVTSKPSAKNS